MAKLETVVLALEDADDLILPEIGKLIRLIMSIGSIIKYRQKLWLYRRRALKSSH